MIQHHIIVAIMQKQSYVYDEILHNFPFFFSCNEVRCDFICEGVLAVDISE